jgi:hypothetical protein
MESVDSEYSMEQQQSQKPIHPLNDKWVLWAHLPHDTDWSLKSYIRIMELSSMEHVIGINNTIPPKMIKNCMLFLMRKGINPTWEDEKNCKGGCFSFKILNKNVHGVWEKLMMAICGESISKETKFINITNGITISPKKSFCILKIWMSTINEQNAKKIIEIEGLTTHGCLFKKHNPEY